MPKTPERTDERPRERPRRVTVERNGPMLVEGPVTVVGDDGVEATSDRFVVAVCTCRRSRTYPWCDTSHRRRGKPVAANDAAGAPASAPAHDAHDAHDGGTR